VVHFVAWLAMAVAVWPALKESSRRSRMMRVAMVVGALTAWGVAVELIQIAIPRRSADLLDALADVAGALVGALVMARIEAARVSGRANAEEATG
jgi:VanZ family protein